MRKILVSVMVTALVSIVVVGSALACSVCGSGHCMNAGYGGLGFKLCVVMGTTCYVGGGSCNGGSGGGEYERAGRVSPGAERPRIEAVYPERLTRQNVGEITKALFTITTRLQLYR